MDLATHSPNRTHAYEDMYGEYVTDASFLWLLRSIRVNQAHYTVEDMAILEQRIEDQLDGLTASIDPGWTACEAALELEEPGEVFVATVTAMRSHEIPKIQKAVQVGMASERTFSALVSALGWLPAEIARPWTERLLQGKDMQHKYLGLAACSVRREDPGEILSDILKREDCRQHVNLHARALRLIGELRRCDLAPALIGAQASDNDTVRFWALWSTILLGDSTAAQAMRPYVLQPGPHRAKAIQLAFRALPIEHAREWISALAHDPVHWRAVITATGVLGDPHAVNWLIGKMTDPKQARLAGEAFTAITGIDLEKHELTMAPPVQEPISEDNDVGLDDDENLPWPDAERIATLWRQHGSNFKTGQRYFLGKPITADSLKHTLTAAYQRQRHAAALELALIDPQSRFINTHAKAAP